MKTLRFLFTLLLFTGFATTASAQFQFGGGGALGFNFDVAGLQAKGQYGFNETWRGAADFTFYFVEIGSAYEINGNAHYIFSSDGAGQNFYALGGLNIWIYDLGIDFGFFGVSETFTDVGLNLGAGANIPLGNLTGYGEAKFAVGGSEFNIAVGVLFGG